LGCLAPETNVTRHERAPMNDGTQQLHHHHYHHHHHHHYQQRQQQHTGDLRARAFSQVHGQVVPSGNRTAFPQLLPSTEIPANCQQAVAMVTDTPASFENAVTSNGTAKTSSLHSTKQFQLLDMPAANSTHPMSIPVVLVKKHEKAEVPFVLPTANTSAAPKVRKPHHPPRPAIAVIQLSNHTSDDRIVYHEPQNRAPSPPTTTTSQHSQATFDGQEQVPRVHVVLPCPSDDQVICRNSTGDSWKQSRATKLARRRTEEHQRCRQS